MEIMNSNVCVECYKKFRHRSSMNRHLRHQHGILPDIQGGLFCPESFCESNFKDYASLRNHLCVTHEFVNRQEVHVFFNRSDFDRWKERTEKETKSFYVVRSKKRLVSGITKTYYICHRSGYVQTETRQKLRIRRNCYKMGSVCPSTMDVSEEDNKIHVEYFPKHFGHQHELKYLKLNKSDKYELAKKLSEGVEVQKILEDVGNSMNSELERIHLLTNQDLRNIRKAKSILKLKRLNSNDAAAIASWVNKDKASQRNLTIFYKPEGSSCFPLNEDDLVLVIMPPPQKQIYEEFCGGTICVDSTHGTNLDDFQFTAIVVVDEFGAGLPAAFCISNRVDQCVLKIFFEAVANATTTASPDVFMSDDVPEIYDAWKEVNDDAKRQLLCTWHVERRWRKALSKISSNKISKTVLEEKKVEVYKQARTLLEEGDVNRFHMLLEDFVGELAKEDVTKRFGIFFESAYVDRPEAWAFCYRPDSERNTNMYLEVMHNALKNYSEVDKRLSCLLTMVKDKMFSRFTQLIKHGKCSKIDMIHDRHKKSLYLTSTVENVNSNTWKIISSNQVSSNVFKVIKIVEDCSGCLLKCFFCEVCIHMYYCTCNDYNVEFNMCKHIHFVQSKQPNTSEVLRPEEVSVKTEIESDVQTLIPETVKSTTVDLRPKFDLACSISQGNEYDTETAEKINKLIDSAISLLSTSGKRKIDQQDKDVTGPLNKNRNIHHIRN